MADSDAWLLQRLAWDTALLGTLLLGAFALPWTFEVLYQLVLQAGFLRALPLGARAALPRHPRRPALAFLAGARFHLALWRAMRRDQPGDAPAVLGYKRRMRASFQRELVWIGVFATTLVMLLARGWRPPVP